MPLKTLAACPPENAKYLLKWERVRSGPPARPGLSIDGNAPILLESIWVLPTIVTKRSLKDPPPEEQPFPVRGYVIINMLFYLFCLLAYWAAYFFQHGEVSGMGPVLAGLAVVFTLVSFYDAMFDRYVYRKRQREQEASRRQETETKPENPVPNLNEGGARAGGRGD